MFGMFAEFALCISRGRLGSYRTFFFPPPIFFPLLFFFFFFLEDTDKEHSLRNAQLMVSTPLILLQSIHRRKSIQTCSLGDHFHEP